MANDRLSLCLLGFLRIYHRLVSRDDTARFVRRLFAAGHDISIRISGILHERRMKRVTMTSWVMICPEIGFIVHFLFHWYGSVEVSGYP